MVGQVLLNKYKVMRPLDEGGMSRIFVAKQLDQNREVVVKVLKPEYAAQPKAREHFRREIHILSSFQHPNTVAYYDADADNPKAPVLVMEYLRGCDLGVLLARDGHFAPDRTGRLLVQLCDVLQAAHDAGIVHRDLKPGNIFIIYPGTPQETVKLMDFGLAKMSSLLYIAPEDITSVGYGQTPTAAGTPEYISPEQLRGTEVDRRSDLYALGVILFELLAGRRPFVRGSVEELLLAHAEEDPPRFADLNLAEAITSEIEQVVRCCLAKTPEDRYQQAVELIFAYEKALGRRLTHGRTFGSAVPALSDSATPAQSRAVAVLQKARAVLGREPGAPSRAVPALQSSARPDPSRSEPHLVRHSLEANMPESMALIKLKGFIFDLGGEVIESLPGLIRVRLGRAEKKEGVFSWLTGSKATPATFPPTDMELHMARLDPSQPGRLTITLLMRPVASGSATAAWREVCQKVTRELQAYLMGR